MDLKSLIAAVYILMQRIHELERALSEEKRLREDEEKEWKQEKEKEKESKARQDEEKRAKNEAKSPQREERKQEEKEREEKKGNHAPATAATGRDRREVKERERKTLIVTSIAPGVSSTNTGNTPALAPARSVPQPVPFTRKEYREQLRRIRRKSNMNGW